MQAALAAPLLDDDAWEDDDQRRARHAQVRRLLRVRSTSMRKPFGLYAQWQPALVQLSPPVRLSPLAAATEALRAQSETWSPKATRFERADAKDSACDASPGWQQVGITVANCLIGAGALGMPYALRMAGWAGLVIILAATMITCYTAKSLVWCFNTLNASPQRSTKPIVTYDELVCACFGRTGAVGMKLMTVAELYGGVVCMVVLHAVSWPTLLGLPPTLPLPTTIVSALMPSNPNPSIDVRVPIVSLVCACALPMLLIRTRYLAVFAACGLCATATLFAAACAVPLTTEALADGTACEILDASNADGDVEGHALWRAEGLGSATGLALFAFAGHATFPELHSRMAPDQRPHFDDACNLGFTIAAIFYCTFAAIGYYWYGDCTSDALTLNLMASSSLIGGLATLGVLASTFTSISVLMVPVVRIVHEGVDELRACMCTYSGCAFPMPWHRVGGGEGAGGRVQGKQQRSGTGCRVDAGVHASSLDIEAYHMAGDAVGAARGAATAEAVGEAAGPGAGYRVQGEAAGPGAPLVPTSQSAAALQLANDLLLEATEVIRDAFGTGAGYRVQGGAFETSAGYRVHGAAGGLIATGEPSVPPPPGTGYRAPPPPAHGAKPPEALTALADPFTALAEQPFTAPPEKPSTASAEAEGLFESCEGTDGLVHTLIKSALLGLAALLAISVRSRCPTPNPTLNPEPRPHPVPSLVALALALSLALALTLTLYLALSLPLALTPTRTLSLTPTLHSSPSRSRSRSFTLTLTLALTLTLTPSPQVPTFGYMVSLMGAVTCMVTYLRTYLLTYLLTYLGAQLWVRGELDGRRHVHGHVLYPARRMQPRRPSAHSRLRQPRPQRLDHWGWSRGHGCRGAEHAGAGNVT